MAIDQMAWKGVCYSPHTTAMMEDKSGHKLEVGNENSEKIVLSYGAMTLEFYGDIEDANLLYKKLGDAGLSPMRITESAPSPETMAWSELANKLFNTPIAKQQARVVVSGSVYRLFKNDTIHPGIKHFIAKEYPKCYPTNSASQTTASALWEA